MSWMQYGTLGFLGILHTLEGEKAQRRKFVDDLAVAFPELSPEQQAALAAWVFDHPPARFQGAIDFRKTWRGRTGWIEPSEHVAKAMRDVLEDHVPLREAVRAFEEASNAWMRAAGLPEVPLARLDVARIAVARARRRFRRWVTDRIAHWLADVLIR